MQFGFLFAALFADRQDWQDNPTYYSYAQRKRADNRVNMWVRL